MPILALLPTLFNYEISSDCGTDERMFVSAFAFAQCKCLRNDLPGKHRYSASKGWCHPPSASPASRRMRRNLLVCVTASPEA